MPDTHPNPPQAPGTDLSDPAPRAGEPPVAAVRLTRTLAVGSLLGLVVLGLAWELWLAPLRPDGSWWVLKVLPLTLPLAGLLKNRMYTYRWVSLLVWLYFTEGVVRAWSDQGLSATLALLQVLLCTTLFVACALHVRSRLRAAGQAAVKADAARHAHLSGAAADPVQPPARRQP